MLEKLEEENREILIGPLLSSVACIDSCHHMQSQSVKRQMKPINPYGGRIEIILPTFLPILYAMHHPLCANEMHLRIPQEFLEKAYQMEHELLVYIIQDSNNRVRADSAS